MAEEETRSVDYSIIARIRVEVALGREEPEVRDLENWVGGVLSAAACEDAHRDWNVQAVWTKDYKTTMQNLAKYVVGQILDTVV